MLRSDSQTGLPEGPLDGTFSNIDNITIEVIAQIERELQPEDLMSMVFLLYDTPDTAKENLLRLTTYQRVSDNCTTNCDLLYGWANYAQAQPTWRYELLEALAICQQYRVIRRLGFNISSVKEHYQADNLQVTVYINPMKKALYKLCENMTSQDLFELQNTLVKTYEVDSLEYRTNEFVILELMCKNFITVGNYKDKFIVNDDECHIEKLAEIIENIEGLRKFAHELREIQIKLNALGETKFKSDDSKEQMSDDVHNKDNDDEFFKSLKDLKIEDIKRVIFTKMLESACTSGEKTLDAGKYPIKNAKRVGVCYIINQENFHPSKDSIESNISIQLERRLGSDKDRDLLAQTMTSLNFEVIIHQDLDHKKILDHIKNIINRIEPDDSMFMLCILSHGVKGQVYAADSVKVKIDDIKSILDDGFESLKLEIPKIMIIQACQVIGEEPIDKTRLVADTRQKLDFLVYWATSPELKAFKLEEHGSIFIQILCIMIKKYAKHEHLIDIITEVNKGVTKFFKMFKNTRVQVPTYESTLRNKIVFTSS